jgi:hypothetical protein
MVTHGFTLSDPSLAWLIVHGHKIIENRQVRFAPGWYAVHIGATAYCHVERELKLIKEFGMPLTMSMKKGHVIGVCKIETGVPHELCKKNRWAVSDYKICNIITEFMAFDKDEEVPATRLPQADQCQRSARSRVQRGKRARPGRQRQEALRSRGKSGRRGSPRYQEGQIESWRGCQA